MKVTKVAQSTENFHRPYWIFENARSAFRAFLEALKCQGDFTVLLPAYVGWSPREGSGVFDPVNALSLPFTFYRVNRDLHIDLEHLELCFRLHQTCVLVLIHFFGYVDPGYIEAVTLARHYGSRILEDEAHALCTDLIGKSSGRLGDACIFSLHKMLPVTKGGMLTLNPSGQDLAHHLISSPEDTSIPWSYDLAAISAKRRENTFELFRLLAPLSGRIDPLWDIPHEGEVPQTLPVIVHNVSRDDLYTRMNKAGLGVVSLYHTLVDPITITDFPDSHWLARRVMNLPVHQDVTYSSLAQLVETLAICVDNLPQTATQ